MPVRQLPVVSIALGTIARQNFFFARQNFFLARQNFFLHSHTLTKKKSVARCVNCDDVAVQSLFLPDRVYETRVFFRSHAKKNPMNRRSCCLSQSYINNPGSMLCVCLFLFSTTALRCRRISASALGVVNKAENFLFFVTSVLSE